MTGEKVNTCTLSIVILKNFLLVVHSIGTHHLYLHVFEYIALIPTFVYFVDVG